MNCVGFVFGMLPVSYIQKNISAHRDEIHIRTENKQRDDEKEEADTVKSMHVETRERRKRSAVLTACVCKEDKQTHRKMCTVWQQQ